MLNFPEIDIESLKTLPKILFFDKENPLLFNTGLFLILFAVFLAIYSAMRKWKTAKYIFVILFSLYFYYKSSAEYCFILLGVCVFDYVLGRALGSVRPRSKCAARWLVALNIIINVGMLVYFKYFNLLYETFANITRTNFDPLNIILPAGISFFTFRSISYIVDIYRMEMKPADNFLEYCFFLTFFPPLLAGPVVRAKDMLPQIKANPVATRAMVSQGLFLIIAGLIKKVVVADYLSANFVDRIFENPHLYSGAENVLGILGFAMQIYCDFSGYSDMAIGLALLLGFSFKDNFNSPFKSLSPTEFWRRWHISLSTWLRDYVYIPMGGNRKGRFRAHINRMTTMVVGGLWHGASWLYLVWGAYQGLLLCGHNIFKTILPKSDKVNNNIFVRAMKFTLTFILTLVGFTLFRFAISSPHIEETRDGIEKMTGQIVNEFKPEIIPQFVEAYPWIVLTLVGAYLIHFLPDKVYTTSQRAFNGLHPLLQTILLAVILFLIIQVRQSDLVPFVYLQY